MDDDKRIKLTLKLYYILSPYAPCGNSALWWAKDAQGYTTDLDKAWQVTFVQAQTILKDKRDDRAFLVSDVEKYAQRHFDIQNLRKINKLCDL